MQAVAPDIQCYEDSQQLLEREHPDLVVVASNGIGTARLLLASRVTRDPDGPLGRYLMFHPVAYARGMFHEELDGPSGPVGACVYSHEFYERHHVQLQVPLAPLTGWHLLGTARMGTDPATSVTDARGRMHEVPNVVVADGSLFPTAGAVNPGATIGALALRIADGVAEDLAS